MNSAISIVHSQHHYLVEVPIILVETTLSPLVLFLSLYVIVDANATIVLCCCRC
jgi:hypothetical protein